MNPSRRDLKIGIWGTLGLKLSDSYSTLGR
jgi:hypothetical protein